MAEGAAVAGSVPESLNEILKELERRRWEVLKGYWQTVAWLVCGTLTVGGAFGGLLWVLNTGMWQSHLHPHSSIISLTLFAMPPVWLFAGGWAFRRFANGPKWRYLDRFKREVFTQVCAHHFPTLKYQPNEGIPCQAFDECRLFPYEADVYYSEDRFSGSTGSTAVTFAEVRAERRKRRLTSKGFETCYVQYFRGLMLVADFHKHFHSTLRVLPAAENHRALPGEERVVTEDPGFETLFVVLGTDQIDARYVLSTSMMGRIGKLARRFGHVRLGFRDDQLTLLLPGGADQFEPSLYRKATSNEQLQRFVADIEAALGLVAELDLNTRIWSKR